MKISAIAAHAHYGAVELGSGAALALYRALAGYYALPTINSLYAPEGERTWENAHMRVTVEGRSEVFLRKVVAQAKDSHAEAVLYKLAVLLFDKGMFYVEWRDTGEEQRHTSNLSFFHLVEGRLLYDDLGKRETFYHEGYQLSFAEFKAYALDFLKRQKPFMDWKGQEYIWEVDTSLLYLALQILHKVKGTSWEIGLEETGVKVALTRPDMARERFFSWTVTHRYGNPGWVRRYQELTAPYETGAPRCFTREQFVSLLAELEQVAREE